MHLPKPLALALALSATLLSAASQAATAQPAVVIVHGASPTAPTGPRSCRCCRTEGSPSPWCRTR